MRRGSFWALRIDKRYEGKEKTMRNTFYDEEDEIEIDLKELFFALKKKLFIILAAGLLTGCLGCAYTAFLASPVYTSTSNLLVLTKETTLASLADLQMGSQLTNDYQVLITSRPVLDEVIENLGLDMESKELRKLITIENPTDTRILQISVVYHDAVMAKNIVNELSQVSAAFIGDKMEVIPPKIIEEGEIPTGKTSPSMKKNALLGLLAGLILSAGVIAVMTVMDDTIKSEEDVSRYLSISTLASIPDRKDYITVKKKSGGKKKRSGPKNEKNQEGK